MADILFVTMETGGLADKSSIYFLLSKTHSILLAEEITRFAEIKKLSYLPVMCGLNGLSDDFTYYVQKLHKRAIMWQWILGRFGFSPN